MWFYPVDWLRSMRVLPLLILLFGRSWKILPAIIEQNWLSTSSVDNELYVSVFDCVQREKRIVEFVADKRTTENTHHVQFVWPFPQTYNFWRWWPIFSNRDKPCKVSLTIDSAFFGKFLVGDRLWTWSVSHGTIFSGEANWVLVAKKLPVICQSESIRPGSLVSAEKC